MEWQLNVPLYVFPTMQRSAKPVAHTMETGIFTVTVHGPLKRRNNLSSTTVFFPFGCGWKLCTTHIVVLEQDVPYQTSVRLFLLGSWAYACNGMTHWAKPPLNIFHFLFKQVRIFCLLHFSELTKMTRSVFSLMLTILDGQNCIVILSIFILQKTNNWA